MDMEVQNDSQLSVRTSPPPNCPTKLFSVAPPALSSQKVRGSSGAIPDVQVQATAAGLPVRILGLLDLAACAETSSLIVLFNLYISCMYECFNLFWKAVRHSCPRKLDSSQVAC